MVIQKGFVQKLVWPILVLTLMVGCNEQEFYEKTFLKGAGVDRPDGTSPVDDTDFGDPIADLDPDDSNDSGDSGNNTDVGDNNDGGSNNPSDPGSDQGDNTDVADNNDGGSNDSGDSGSNQDDNTDVADNNDGGSNDSGDSGDSGNDQDDNTDVADNNDGGSNDSGDTGSDPGSDQGDNTDIADGNDNNDEEEEVVTPGPSLAEVIDQFTQAQEKRSKVDILWVIDDSGSMGDEQAALAYNFDAFITGFLNEDVDFKMGITTTDGTARGDGKWAINYTHLTRAEANKDEAKFLRDFKRSVQVGTRGSAKEMGLHTAQRFLERYDKRIPDPFLRDDAYLIVVVLSDEEDQSPRSVESYVSFLKSQKTNAAMVKLYSIVAMRKTPYQWETVGHRYMEASDETNGVKHHIKDNFYHILRGMGSQIVELTRSFALSATPHEGQVVVKVNGEVATGWSYQAETRSVSFAEELTPAAGSSISVEYKKVIGSH